MTEDERKFAYYGIRERHSFQSLAGTTPEIGIIAESSVTGKSRWDVLFISGCSIFLSELKIRDHKSNKYREWVFEKIKYDDLMKACNSERARTSGVTPVFITFFRDCVVGWDVSLLTDSDFHTEHLRHQSVNGNTKKKDKSVTYLEIDDALFVEYYVTDKQLLDRISKRKYAEQFPDFPLPDGI